jgi:hypothetical protein
MTGRRWLLPVLADAYVRLPGDRPGAAYAAVLIDATDVVDWVRAGIVGTASSAKRPTKANVCLRGTAR